MERWTEKEGLLDYYARHDRFPCERESATSNADESKSGDGDGFIETEVQVSNYLEIGQIFVVLATWALAANILAKIWDLVMNGTLTI